MLSPEARFSCSQVTLAISVVPQRARGTINPTCVRKKKAMWVGNSEGGGAGDVAEDGEGFRGEQARRKTFQGGKTQERRVMVSRVCNMGARRQMCLTMRVRVVGTTPLVVEKQRPIPFI